MADDVVVDPDNVQVVDMTTGKAPTDTQVADTQDTGDLLAGKYKTPEELVDAYKSLEAKLGAQPPTVDSDDVTVTPTDNPLTLQPTDKQVDDKVTAGDKKKTASELLDTFEDSFATSGELTADQLKLLEKKGMSEADALLLLNTRKQEADKQITDLLEPVGGLEEWGKVTEFLVERMQPETQQEFNDAMSGDNILVKQLLIQHAKDTFDQEQGVAPSAQIKGDNNKVVGKTDTFATQKEMAQAVGDIKYRTDVNHRKEVDAKILRSNQDTMNGF